MQTFETISALLFRIEYKNWKFHLEERADCFTLQIQFLDKCVITGEYEIQYCRKWFLSKHMTDNEIIRTAFLAVEIAERHELMEKFQLDGKLINNPHFDVLQMKNIGISTRETEKQK